MKERLYNEYGAALGNHVTNLDRIVRDAVNEAFKYALENNLDLRDVCHNFNNATHNYFAHHILWNAFKMKEEEKKQISATGAVAETFAYLADARNKEANEE